MFRVGLSPFPPVQTAPRLISVPERQTVYNHTVFFWNSINHGSPGMLSVVCPLCLLVLVISDVPIAHQVSVIDLQEVYSGVRPPGSPKITYT